MNNIADFYNKKTLRAMCRAWALIAIYLLANFTQSFAQQDSIRTGLRELGERSVSDYEEQNNSGIENKALNALNLSAAQLKAIVVAAGVTDFKVFDYTAYSLIGRMENPEFWNEWAFGAMDSIIRTGTKPQYGYRHFLLIAKEIDPSNGKVKYRVKLRLPTVENPLRSANGSRSIVTTLTDEILKSGTEDIIDYITNFSKIKNEDFDKIEEVTKGGLGYSNEVVAKMLSGKYLKQGYYYDPTGYPIYLPGARGLIPIDKILTGDVANYAIYSFSIKNGGIEETYEAQLKYDETTKKVKFWGYELVLKNKESYKGIKQFWGYPDLSSKKGQEIPVFKYIYNNDCKGSIIKTKYKVPTNVFQLNYTLGLNVNTLEAISNSSLGGGGYIEDAKDVTGDFTADATTNEIEGCKELEKDAQELFKLFPYNSADCDICKRNIAQFLSYTKKFHPDLVNAIHVNKDFSIPSYYITDEGSVNNQLSRFAYDVFIKYEESNFNKNYYDEVIREMRNYYQEAKRFREMDMNNTSALDKLNSFYVHEKFLVAPILQLTDDQKFQLLNNLNNRLNWNASTNQLSTNQLITYIFAAHLQSKPNEVKSFLEKMKTKSGTRQLIHTILSDIKVEDLGTLTFKLVELLQKVMKSETEGANVSSISNLMEVPWDIKVFGESLYDFTNNADTPLKIHFGEQEYDCISYDNGTNGTQVICDYMATGNICEAAMHPYDLILVKASAEDERNKFFQYFKFEGGYYVMPAAIFYLQKKENFEKSKAAIINAVNVGLAITFLSPELITLRAAIAAKNTALIFEETVVIAGEFGINYAILFSDLTTTEKSDLAKVYMALHLLRFGVKVIPKSTYDDIFTKGEAIAEKFVNDANTVRKSWAQKLISKINYARGSVFKHNLTSGAIVTNKAKYGTFLIGSFQTDLKFILEELNSIKIKVIDFKFPIPFGQKTFNILDIADEAYNYWATNGGFFTKVNGPWVDAAVLQKADIVVVTNPYISKNIYNTITKDRVTIKELTGFGKEIHRLEWKHGYRFDPKTKMMLPPNQSNGLNTITKFLDYTH